MRRAWGPVSLQGQRDWPALRPVRPGNLRPRTVGLSRCSSCSFLDRVCVCVCAFPPCPSVFPLLSPPPLQPAAAAWRAPPAASVTGARASARATPGPWGSSAMAAGQATGGSPTAAPASVTDAPPSVTSGPEAASRAGPTLEGSGVKGQRSNLDQRLRAGAGAEPPLSLGVRTATMATQTLDCAIRALVLVGPTVDDTLLLTVTRTTKANKSSATASRVT